ncbi:hypothetical protein VNO77_16706 [Canavalia gladiata]|uniref:Uncharacterized protein n=1 Tax=Canavalia gladiata TaxID=3824 RepID=A0AAN9LMH8_CANGL
MQVKPVIKAVLPPPSSNPLDYFNGNGTPSALVPDDMAWMSSPPQNPALHDQMGKQYLRPWNRWARKRKLKGEDELQEFQVVGQVTHFILIFENFSLCSGEMFFNNFGRYEYDCEQQTEVISRWGNCFLSSDSLNQECDSSKMNIIGSFQLAKKPKNGCGVCVTHLQLGAVLLLLWWCGYSSVKCEA